MALKSYDFSGVTVGVQSENELSESTSLKKFRSEIKTPDCLVKLSFAPFISDETVNESTVSYSKKSKVKAGAGEEMIINSRFLYTCCYMTVIEHYEKDFDIEQVLRHMPLHHLLLKHGAFILHASYILINGEAILFSAPSGTGKSTQAELWKKYRGAEIINGDRVLVRKSEKGFTAGGIYYSGTSEYCENVSAPIRAIVLLGQAENNTAEKCGGAEALRSLFRQSAYTADFPNDPALLSQLLSEAVNSVDIVKLDCLPDESAVSALEKYLSGDN